MSYWANIIIVLHVLVALGIIGLVLLQHGKGADMGSGFGGGASASLFGATGSANFLSRLTGVLATVFFLSSLGLAYVATTKPRVGGGVMDRVKVQEAAKDKPAAQQPAPAAPQSVPGDAPVKPSEPAKDKTVPQ
jgi:preprotein translocase subunit SecG